MLEETYGVVSGRKEGHGGPNLHFRVAILIQGEAEEGGSMYA